MSPTMPIGKPSSASTRSSRPPFAAVRLSPSVQLALVVTIALTSGVMASVGAYRFLTDRAKAAASHSVGSLTSVVVARQDLSAGDTVGPGMVEIVPWPMGHHPAQSFSSLEEAQGRVIKTAIFRGEPLVDSRLVPQGERAGLQVRIPPGLLAMSVKVDPEIGVSGFIQPGNRVDVVATMRIPGASPITKVVLQHLLVLAVEHQIEQHDEHPTDATTVTLAVTPEEAEKLALASREGAIMLALRNLRDEHQHETPGFSVAELARLRPNFNAEASNVPAVYAPSMPALRPATHVPAPEPASAQEAVATAPDQLAAPIPAPLPTPRYHVIQLIEGESTSEVKFELP